MGDARRGLLAVGGSCGGFNRPRHGHRHRKTADVGTLSGAPCVTRCQGSNVPVELPCLLGPREVEPLGVRQRERVGEHDAAVVGRGYERAVVYRDADEFAAARPGSKVRLDRAKRSSAPSRSVTAGRLCAEGWRLFPARPAGPAPSAASPAAPACGRIARRATSGACGSHVLTAVGRCAPPPSLPDVFVGAARRSRWHGLVDRGAALREAGAHRCSSQPSATRSACPGAARGYYSRRRAEGLECKFSRVNRAGRSSNGASFKRPGIQECRSSSTSRRVDHGRSTSGQSLGLVSPAGSAAGPEQPVEVALALAFLSARRASGLATGTSVSSPRFSCAKPRAAPRTPVPRLSRSATARPVPRGSAARCCTPPSQQAVQRPGWKRTAWRADAAPCATSSKERKPSCRRAREASWTGMQDASAFREAPILRGHEATRRRSTTQPTAAPRASPRRPREGCRSKRWCLPTTEGGPHGQGQHPDLHSPPIRRMDAAAAQDQDRTGGEVVAAACRTVATRSSDSQQTAGPTASVDRRAARHDVGTRPGRHRPGSLRARQGRRTPARR